jgi:hypothetical protein
LVVDDLALDLPALRLRSTGSAIARSMSSRSDMAGERCGGCTEGARGAKAALFLSCSARLVVDSFRPRRSCSSWSKLTPTSNRPACRSRHHGDPKNSRTTSPPSWHLYLPPLPRSAGPLRPSSVHPSLRPPRRSPALDRLPTRRIRRFPANVLSDFGTLVQAQRDAEGVHERRCGCRRGEYGCVHDGEGWHGRRVGYEGFDEGGIQAQRYVQ